MSQKILSAQASGTWDGPNGTLHRIEVLLDDGTSGEVMAKTPDRWKPGDEVEVKSKKETQYGVKLKLDRPGYGDSGGQGPARTDRDVRIGAQWAINAAIDYLPAKASVATIEATARELLGVRDRLVQ